jgi:hypothetical protein
MQNYVYGRARGDEWIVPAVAFLSMVSYGAWVLITGPHEWLNGLLVTIAVAFVTAFVLTIARRLFIDLYARYPRAQERN